MKRLSIPQLICAQGGLERLLGATPPDIDTLRSVWRGASLLECGRATHLLSVRDPEQLLAGLVRTCGAAFLLTAPHRLFAAEYALAKLEAVLQAKLQVARAL